jgi:hypothetical protein
VTEPIQTSDIIEVVGQMAPDTARKLLEELDWIPDSRSPRLASIRANLLLAVNRRRTQLARRLFTTLFDPFLCRDAGFLDPACAPPGFIHRIDIGALWHALSAQSLGGLALGGLAERAQARLTELLHDRTAEQVLSLPDALKLLEELAAAATAPLEAALKAPDRHRTLLDAMNRWREREARRLTLSFGPRPLTRGDLELYRDVLVFNDLAVPLMMLVDEDRKAGHSLAHRAGALSALEAVTGGTGRGSMLPALLPLVMLHEHRDYRGVADLLHLGGPASLTNPIWEALERHLRRLCVSLAEELTGTAAGTASAGPIVIPAPHRDALARDLRHFRELTDICAELDLIGHPRIGAACRSHLSDLIAKIEHAVYPRLLDRIIVAANNLHRASPDHDAVCWLTGFIRDWRQCFQGQIHWGSQYNRFRQDCQDFLRRAFRTAVLTTDYDDVLTRFDHFGRIDALAAQIGASAADWLTSLDHSLIRVLTERLKLREALGPVERRLCSAALPVVDRELAQIKYWKDPLLLEFSTLATGKLDNKPAQVADGSVPAGPAPVRQHGSIHNRG